MDFPGQVDWGRPVGLFYHLIGAGTAGLGYAGRAFRVQSGGGCEPWTRRSGFGALGCHSRRGPLREERRLPMVWTAVLLVLLLVPGRGEALYEWRCDEYTARDIAAGDITEDQLTLHGFFVAPDKQTRLFLRVRLNEEEYPYYECSLQHEDGPLSQAGINGVDFVGRCRDPISGRDHAISSALEGGAGGSSYLQYWSVQPDTEQVTLEYRQGRFMGEGGEPLRDADGRCVWRPRKAARTLFDNTIAALRAGIEELDAEALALLAVGDTRTLPTRPLPAAVVRRWLHALHTHAPVFATFETARYSEESPTQSWRLIQILGRQLCRAPGVVLLQDTRSGQWRSIYAVPSGCSKTLNFPLQDMVITGDTLFADFCTDCIFWGRYGKFRLDLPTNRVTRLEETEEPWGENIPVTDPLAFVSLDGSDPPSAADAAR